MDADRAIRSRKTEKVLAVDAFPVTDIAGTVDELIALAGLAPFHRACDESHRQSELDGIEPWRFYVLHATECRQLAPRLTQENAGKIPAMLASADALILATWLPHPGEPIPMGDEPGFAMSLTNVEHIAAASAAIQNMLLAATARNIRNYWSSGGVLRSAEIFSQLSIPSNQILLGAIFLFPEQIGDAELATSKLRQLRTTPEHWSRRVTLAKS